MGLFKNELLDLALSKNDIVYDDYVEDDDHNEFGIVCSNIVKSNEDSIAIEIISYKDSQLVNTVKSAVIQADHSDRLHFIIGYQYDEINTLSELKKINNCKIIHIPLEKAEGVCYARNLCQKGVSDEKYVLHVDPHMRFIKHWDTALIEFLESKHDPKGFISSYPAGVSDADLKLPLDDIKFSKPSESYCIYARSFRDIYGSSCYHDTLYSQATYYDKNDLQNMKCDRTPFIGAGYFFGYACMDKEVRVDPNMWLYGDESPIALRLFTYGYNNYVFDKCYILHKWSHTGHSYQNITARGFNENERMQKLVRGELHDAYGLGNVRTLAEYEAFAGIDFSKKLLRHHAQLGKFGFDVRECDRQPTFNALLNSRQNLRCVDSKFHIFIFDVDGHAVDCLNNIIATVNDFRKIDVTIISNKSITVESDVKYKRCDAKSFSDYFWSMKDEIRNDNDYILCMLSNMRFVKDWYEYYLDAMACLSDRDVITSSVSSRQLNNSEVGLMPDKVTYVGTNNTLNSKFINIDMKRISQTGNFKYVGVKLHPYLVDYFLIAKSAVFSDLIKDSEISFSNFLPVLSIRLFTQGYNLGYCNKTYIFTKNYCDDMASVFSESNDLRFKGIMDFNNMSFDRYTEPLEKSKFENMDMQYLRSRSAFYFNCGFDFSNVTTL